MKVDDQTITKKHKTVILSEKRYEEITQQRKKILMAFSSMKTTDISKKKQRILKQCKTINDIHFSHSLLALHEKSYDKAIKLLQQCISENNDIIGYLLLANTLMKVHRPFQSIKVLQHAIHHTPHHKLYNMLGIAFRTVCNIQAAKIAFSQATTINPHFSPAMINLSNLYFDTQEYDAALSILKRLLFVSKNVGVTMKKIGRCYLYKHEITPALFWYNRAYRQKALHYPKAEPKNIH